MQVRVWRLGEVAMMMFSPFLFWRTRLSNRIITIYSHHVQLITIQSD